MSQVVLVTGGAGYIGSHTCVELLGRGDDVVVVDDLSNSSEASLDRVREITGRDLTFHRADICDREAMERIFDAHDVRSVVHFAGKKAVGESVEIPLEYYRNNVVGTLVLVDAMRAHGVRDLVFSSSATVYGDPHTVPIREDFPLSATNPYGRTKLMIEEILRDLAVSDLSWRIILLRYFNPVGAHPSGRIGEDPVGIPNNLMPYVMQVAVGKREALSVFGNDYDTKDGTGVRDFIHVVDLSKGHLAALDALDCTEGCVAYNLGTGTGYSVLDVVKAAETAAGRDIPYRITPRRPGDVGTCYADPSLSSEKLGWKAELGLAAMVTDHWRWQSANPDGYSE